MDSLPRLLRELREAERERLRVPRETEAYDAAADRVDRVAREIWEAAARDRLADLPDDGPTALQPDGDDSDALRS